MWLNFIVCVCTYSIHEASATVQYMIQTKKHGWNASLWWSWTPNSQNTSISNLGVLQEPSEEVSKSKKLSKMHMILCDLIHWPHQFLENQISAKQIPICKRTWTLAFLHDLQGWCFCWCFIWTCWSTKWFNDLDFYSKKWEPRNVFPQHVTISPLEVSHVIVTLCKFS